MIYKDKEAELRELHKDNEDELKKACEENVKELKSNYKAIREKRGECAECQKHEELFGYKLIEYLWRRENKKNGYDAFERLLEAIRHVEERAGNTAGKDNRYVYHTN